MVFNISEAEWEVMRVVWSNIDTTSKIVIDTLSSKKGWSVSTLKTLLSRLVEKNMLNTRKQGNKFIYNAVYSENDCLESITKEFLNKICARKTGLIIKIIIDEDRLSVEDIDNTILKLKEKKKTAKKVIECNCVKGQCTCHNNGQCICHR
ncbi:CopY/TcrY family copper transport repressor [Gemella bergeri]